jgi:hypothetical protein
MKLVRKESAKPYRTRIPRVLIHALQAWGIKRNHFHVYGYG